MRKAIYEVVIGSYEPKTKTHRERFEVVMWIAKDVRDAIKQTRLFKNEYISEVKLLGRETE